MRHVHSTLVGFLLPIFTLAGLCAAQSAATSPAPPPPDTPATAPAGSAGDAAATQPASPDTQPAAATQPAGKPAPAVAVHENIEAVKTYARGEYAKAAGMIEPDYRAGRAGIQDRLILARAYMHLSREADALAVLKNVLETDRENPEANSLAGQLTLKAGQPKDALKYLEQAYRLKPEATTAAALGRCYYELGDVVKAKACLTDALSEDIRNPANSLLLGRINLDRGSGALAEKYLLMAQEAGLESRELHLLLGKAYMLQQKALGPVTARRLPGRCKTGDVIDGQVVLGQAPTQAGQVLVCTRYCALHEGMTLLRADANDADGRYMAAAGWFAAGQYKLAQANLDGLSTKDAQRPEVCRLRARLLVEMKDFKQLDKFLAEAKAAGVLDSAAVADYLCKAAAVMRSEGKRDQAIATLRQAEKEQPTAEAVLRPLAALYEATGNDKQAAAYYARLVELLPDAADIDELNNTLKVLREKAGVTK